MRERLHDRPHRPQHYRPHHHGPHRQRWPTGAGAPIAAVPIATAAVVAAILVVAGLLLALPATGTAQAFPPPSDYIVGPRDVLAVTVLNEPTLSGKFTVVADGTFSYPLIGAVKVGGLSVRSVERELTMKLGDGFLERPIVNVALDQFGSQRVLIVGEVRQPASYPLTGRTTVLEALLTAGAATANAGPEALVVRAASGANGGATAAAAAATRGSRDFSNGSNGDHGSGRTSMQDAERVARASGAPILRVNLDALQRGDLSQNVLLEPGDMVFVPRADPPAPIYVMGQVRSPGAYQLPKGASVLQALAQAGGVTELGTTRRVTIVRKNAQGRAIELKAAPDDLLQPGDTIVVHRRLF